MKQFNTKLPGLVIALLVALVAWYLGKLFPLIGGPVIAIFLGMLLNQWVSSQSQFTNGLNFSSKYILQTAVVLLGFGLNLNQVLKVGYSSLPIIVSTILTSLLIAYLGYKLFKIDRDTAILVGVGSSICGGSAIAATAPVIDAEESDVAQAISVIFLFNILAAILFPILGQILGLSNEGFAIFAGTAVNDTSSVTATATAWDAIHHSNTLDNATIVKLTRTLAIIPITLALSYITNRQTSNGQSFSFKRAFPKFLLYFVLASLFTTLFDSLGINIALFSQFKTLSKFFIIMAMAAIGMKTNIGKLIRSGGPAILLGALCWISITIVSLLMQSLMGSW